MSNEKIQVYLRLIGEEVKRFLRIKDSMGLKNDTEVVRSLITWYWKTHEDELTPKLFYVNLDEDGVKVFDKKIPKLVSIIFSPKGMKCEHCQKNTCLHTDFALSIPDVQRVIRRRRKEGWNLPDV